MKQASIRSLATHRHAFWSCTLGLTALAWHASAQSIVQPVLGRHGMVVCREPLAAQIGIDILKDGGNAVDAAIAVQFALAVTLPQAGNIGGGGFMLAYDAARKQVAALDYREKAPLAATTDMFVNGAGEVDATLSRASRLAAGVPGSVKGMEMAHQRFGSKPWAELIAPAIALARDGFRVDREMAESLAASTGLLQRSAAGLAIFTRDGKPLQEGDTLVQADLARTLETIGKEGASGFYGGRVAKLVADDMQRHGGLITEEDLARYEGVWREPVRGSYRGHDIISMPPPSSGGVHLIQILQVLEHFDLEASGPRSAKTIHLCTEAMRHAYADRSKHLGDPDFYEVPVAWLTSKAYAKEIADRIDPERATPSSEVAPGMPVPPESPQTTHFAVADPHGNIVANTTTLNLAYGSGIVVEGAGFFLNNEMDDFSAKPGVPNAFGLLGGKANAIEPGKRMLSSMTPTLVFKEGKPAIVCGGVGGSRIITAVAQNIVNVIDFGLNAQESINAPRFHHQWLPDVLYLEPGFSPDTIHLLDRAGHRVQRQSPNSVAALIRFRDDGLLEGAGDPRRSGVASGF